MNLVSLSLYMSTYIPQHAVKWLKAIKKAFVDRLDAAFRCSTFVAQKINLMNLGFRKLSDFNIKEITSSFQKWSYKCSSKPVKISQKELRRSYF